MPLAATNVRPSVDESRNAIGVWMRDGGESGQPVRVFVTYDAIWQSEPSKVRDVISAWEIFNDGRERFEKLASDRFDADGPDDGTHEGQPFIILHANDIS